MGQVLKGVPTLIPSIFTWISKNVQAVIQSKRMHALYIEATESGHIQAAAVSMGNQRL